MVRLRDLRVGTGPTLGVLSLVVGMSLVLAPGAAHAGDDDPRATPWRLSEPQAKVNWVDLHEAPKVKLYLSFVDKRLRPVDMERFVKRLTILRKPEGDNAKELFSFVNGEVRWPKGEDGEEVEHSEDEEPTLTLLADEERGMALVVAVTGTSAAEYREGPLGPAMRTATELLFKSGKNNKMNGLWVSDEVLTYVQGTNRGSMLTPIETVREACDKWRMIQAEEAGQDDADADKGEGDDKGGGFAKDEIYCGLTKEYGDIPKLMAATAFEGWYPHLFGLDNDLCNKKPRFPRRTSDLKLDVDPEESPPVPSALDVAFEMVLRDAEPGQPRGIVLIGDGRDGYLNAAADCNTKFMAECMNNNAEPKRRDFRSRKALWAARRKWKKAVAQCVKDGLAKREIFSQERFRDKLPRWIGLAQASGTRIFTLANSLASPAERDRLEVLALRTGGTFRVASDSNELVEQASVLADELSNQIVVTFVDDQAVPGADVAYLAVVGYESDRTRGKAKTELARGHVPKVPTGFGPWVRGVRRAGEKKLGKAGLLAVVAVVALLLLVILFKLGKKLLGKGKKAGGGVAKKGKGALKGAAKGAKTIRKIKK